MTVSSNQTPTSLAQIYAAAMPVSIEQFFSYSIQKPSEKPQVERQVLEALRRRNGLVDRIFYHVEPEDETQVVRHDHQRGAIIVVYPEKAKPIIYFEDPVQFFEAEGDKGKISGEIVGIAVAGVGSSPIGAVALARDVATVKNGPIAAVVSGYGLDDVVYEALGGWFFLRETNRLEFLMEQISNALAKASNISVVQTPIEVMDSIGSGPDLVTLKSLVRAKATGDHLQNLKWLIGHSKGNLLISSAISELSMEGHDLISGLNDVRIVLLSALSALPQGVGKQYQIIGNMDALGWLNSRINIDHKTVDRAMHHLNRKLPFHLDAQQELSVIP